MELNAEEHMVLHALHETSVRDPLPNFSASSLVVPLDVTIDKLLTLGYIEIGELPPKSGEHWYFHTSKVLR